MTEYFYFILIAALILSEIVPFTHSFSCTAIWLKFPSRLGTNAPSGPFADCEVVDV